VGEHNAKGELQTVIDIRPSAMQRDDQIASRLDEIGALADGWHDKKGVALDRKKLSAVYECLVGHYPENLPLPAIVPTPEGNLLFEWKGPGDPSLDLHLETLTADFHAFGKGGNDVEASFSMLKSDDWDELFAFLDKHLSKGLG
jgi:hypothetical protein